MAPKTKPEAKPKADKSKKEKPAPKKVEAKKDTKDAKAPAKAVQKALKVCNFKQGVTVSTFWMFCSGPKEGREGCSWNQSEEGQDQCQVLQAQDLQATKVKYIVIKPNVNKHSNPIHN